MVYKKGEYVNVNIVNLSGIKDLIRIKEGKFYDTKT